MAKINTILFDFDGTVMDTNAVILASWQHFFMALEGKERPPAEIIKTFGEPLDVTLKKLYPGRDIDELVPIYRNYHLDNYEKMIELFPGIRELLITLKAKNYKTGLVTSRLRRSTMMGLDKFGIKDCFDAIITCEDTDKHKPDPEPVLAALAKLGSKPGESLMLGDTEFDILCAMSAGVKVVLAGWSIAVTGEENKSGAVPDFVINRAEELLEILSGEV